jgi:hypothetical protein
LTRSEQKQILEIYRVRFKEDPEKLAGEEPRGENSRDSVVLFRAHERLVDSVQVSDNDLRALAQRRASGIREYLSGRGMIDPGRIFLEEVDTAAKAVEGLIRATMTLTAH